MVLAIFKMSMLCTILDKLYNCHINQLSGYIRLLLKVPPKLIPAGIAMAKNNCQSIGLSLKFINPI